MKKIFILTSVLALAACGGGGGSGGGGAPVGGGTSVSGGPHAATTSGMAALFALQENPTVNESNTALTGMASYTVSTGVNDASLLTYVQNKLGSGVYSQENYNSLNRRATLRRNGSTPLSGTDDEIAAKKKAIALAKVSEMKTVLYNMVNADDPVAYVDGHTDAVVEALTLFGKLDGLTDEQIAALSSEDLKNRFEDGGDLITKDTVMAKFENFDSTNFGFTKETLANVIFKDAGADAVLKFKLDDNGTITHIGLMENPIDEYGNGDDNQKYEYTPSSHYLVRVARTGADEDYRVSKEGWFERSGTSKNFNSTYYEYKIALGDHNVEGAEPRSEFQNLKVYSDKANLSDEELKAAAIEALLAEGNKLFSSQPDAASKEKINAVVKYYADLLTDATDFVSADPGEHEYVVSTKTINGVATVDGIGKDVGLQFADFGYATLTETIGDESETIYSPFAGGYASRKMDQATPNDDLNGATFTGQVIAAVEHSKKVNGSEQPKHDMLVRGNGVLTYNVVGDKAVHTLTATNLKDVTNSSNDWYNVTVTGTTGESLNFAFDGSNKNIPSEYQFFTAEMDGANMVVTGIDSATMTGNAVARTLTIPGGEDPDTVLSGADNYRVRGDADPQYYGADPNAPTEATTRFSFSEEWHSNDNQQANEVAVYGAFGGKR